MHREFEVHMLNEQGKEKARRIAQAFDILLTELEDVVGITPPGVPMPGPNDRAAAITRAFAITKTKLEEACFFAKKAMASNLENCQPKEM